MKISNFTEKKKIGIFTGQHSAFKNSSKMVEIRANLDNFLSENGNSICLPCITPIQKKNNAKKYFRNDNKKLQCSVKSTNIDYDENKTKCTYGCGSYVLTTELSNHLSNDCNKRYVICGYCSKGQNTLTVC